MQHSLALRQRILLTLLPLILLLAAVGGTAVWLMHEIGSRIQLILQENYESVLAMQDLKESLERIDSSFQFLLVAQHIESVAERHELIRKARANFETNVPRFDAALAKEKANITIYPEEEQLVSSLDRLSQDYRRQSEKFFQRDAQEPIPLDDYYGSSKLYETFLQIKQVADEVLNLNQATMKQASEEARRSAMASLIWLSLGLGFAVLLALLSAWWTIRSTLGPIIAVKEAALGITAGNLHQLVPVFSQDELGQLAEAFNVMTHHLREYRQSQSAHLLRAQQTSQAAIDSFPDAILVIDSDGQVEMANPAARRLLGVAPKKLLGTAIAKWQPPEPLRVPLDEALLGQQDFLPEGFDRLIQMGQPGVERAFLPRILTIRDADRRTLGAAVVLQDVTRLRLMDQVKSDLVATASHELKTPLTSIRLAVHLLLEETVGPLTTKQTELLLDARENCERLLAMVNNLLDLARLEQGSQRLELESTSASSLLSEVADAFQAPARDKGVDLEVDVPAGLPALNLDVKRMGHALRNLVDNALAYTESGGKIRLSAEQDRDAVVLTVSDTGCGIEPEYLPRVFQKFFRVPGQRQGGGTGLGLAIVWEIVTAHQGTVDCQSTPGVGTTFRVRLPVATRNGNGVAITAENSLSSTTA